MPFTKFDRSKLDILPLSERNSDLDLSVIMDVTNNPKTFDNPKIDQLAEDIISARKKGAAVILMYGAHVIRSGCAKYMLKLMEEGYVTHFATNGAGAIHDFEFALAGETCESVAKYISEGQFGLWHESGIINDVLKEGAALGLGAGESIGRYIWENNFPNRDTSVLANAYKNQIPATVHIGIGNDIIHEHPNCDGAVLGETSYTDFLIYAETISKLQHGVFLNFGSAVAGPEVYLKCLAMARNVAKQENREIFDITTAVFDLLPIEGDDYNATPPKTDPRYYFRPWKTILSRTVADGGKSYYIQGTHDLTLPALASKIFEIASYAEEKKEWVNLYYDSNRLDAIENGKIINPKFLAKIAMEAQTDNYNHASDICIAALDRISDETDLIRIATKSVYDDNRRNAFRRILDTVERITDEEILIQKATDNRYDVLKDEYHGIIEGWKIRQAAVKNITSEDALKNIATMKDISFVRIAAIEKITDQAFLRKIATDKDAYVRETAVKRITDEEFLKLIVRNDNNDNVRKTAVKRITDEEFLIDMAKHSHHVGVAAVNKITNEAALIEIVKKRTDDKYIRKAAIEKITDENFLREISNVEEDWDILYNIAMRIKVDDTVWIKIAKSASYEYYNDIVYKFFSNEETKKEIISHWESKGVYCYSKNKKHDWEDNSFHSNGWDYYPATQCKICGEWKEGGDPVDNR